MIRKTNFVLIFLILTLMVFGLSTFAQEEPVKMGIVCEITGGGAAHGTMWRDGILMAVDEINKAGGILGRKVDVFTLDTQTRPPVSIAAMKRAVGKDPFAVFGTIYSSSTIANMNILENAGIPQIVGSTSTAIYEKESSNIFSTSPINRDAFKPVTRWMVEEFEPSKIAMVYTNDEMGADGWDKVSKYLEGNSEVELKGIAVTNGQSDFAGELERIKNFDADLVFLYGHEEENAKFLDQMKSLGMDTQVVGYSTLVNAQTIELAGEAINGVQGVSTWSTKYGPIKNFVEKFKLRYGEEPTHDAIKGYVGFYTVKAAIEAVGEFDRDKVKDFLHENPITTEMEPNVYLDLRYRDDGTVDRELFLIGVENQEQKLIKLIPPEKPEAFD